MVKKQKSQKRKINSDDKTLAIVTHIISLFVNLFAPLIILIVTKSEYVKKHARRALNWQISLLIYFIFCFIAIVALFFLSAVSMYFLIFLGIFFLIVFALGILDFVFCIIGAVKAGDEEIWSYPLAIPFLRD